MFQRRPKISICVPNYNNRDYLAHCLNSILAQSFADYEVIVVDDHSTDDSIDIIESFDDSRIRLFRNPHNMGIARVRNNALSQCRAKFVTSLDSDDYYYDVEKLRAEWDICRRGRRAGGPVIAFSDVMRVDQSGADLFRVGARKEIHEGNLFKGLIERSIFIPRDYLCPTQWLKKVGGYNEAYPIYEDWDLKLRLARHHDFAFSRLIGIGYRVTGTGLSAMPQDQQDIWIARIKHRAHCEGMRQDLPRGPQARS